MSGRHGATQKKQKKKHTHLNMDSIFFIYISTNLKIAHFVANTNKKII